MSPPRKFLLEGCAVDPLLDEDRLLARVLEACERNLVTLLVTHLTYQDLEAIPDDARREDLLRVVGQLSPRNVEVPALLVAPDQKRARATYPGTALPVGEEVATLLQRLKVDQRADARQAVAAHWAQACLVTNDEGLIRRAEREGICAMLNVDFASEVDRLLRAGQR